MKPSDICRHLRTKKMYVPAQADELFTETAEETGPSGHCWCNRTLTEVGPDNRQVGFQVCSRSRPCFEE